MVRGRFFIYTFYLTQHAEQRVRGHKMLYDVKLFFMLSRNKNEQKLIEINEEP